MHFMVAHDSFTKTRTDKILHYLEKWPLEVLGVTVVLIYTGHATARTTLCPIKMSTYFYDDFSKFSTF